eukprot:4747319-Amphidinium_carterae.1
MRNCSVKLRLHLLMLLLLLTGQPSYDWCNLENHRDKARCIADSLCNKNPHLAGLLNFCVNVEVEPKLLPFVAVHWEDDKRTVFALLQQVIEKVLLAELNMQRLSLTWLPSLEFCSWTLGVLEACCFPARAHSVEDAVCYVYRPSLEIKR